MSNGIILSQLSPQGVKITFSGSNSSAATSYDFTTQLTSGVISQIISYPTLLSSIPTTINCFLENDRDNYSYIYNVSNATTSGFQLNLSDYTKTSGYILLTEVNL